MIKLSIIIPYYKWLDKLLRLYKILKPQITPEVEVIIIDDGCNETALDTLGCTVIHLPTNSGGASVPRNVGLDTAQGDYIAFIDSDDTVSTFYISNILKTIEKGYDYFYISWADSKNYVLIKDEPPSWNRCVWNCVYKRDLIGDNRFDPALKMAEDDDFNRRVRRGRKGNVLDILYYYDTTTPNSLTKQGTLYNEKYKVGDR